MTTNKPETVQESTSHDWDDQDKCRRCGDRDWYASATCKPKQQPAVQSPLQRQSVLNLSEAARSLGIAQEKGDQDAIEYWGAKVTRFETEVIQSAEQQPDDDAVDRFATAMKAKLNKKRQEGRGGWQSMTAEQLSSLLHEHVRKGDPVDVANLAMMLHQNGQRIEQHPVPDVSALLAEALELLVSSPFPNSEDFDKAHAALATYHKGDES